MKKASRALSLLLLLVLTISQSADLGSSGTYYQFENKTYQYTYGSGPAADATIGDRASSMATSGSQDSLLVSQPGPTGPPPVLINCPYNQVYDNVLCQCVCILGYHFEGSECVLSVEVTPNCSPRQTYKNGRCVCQNQYYLIGNTCDVCPPYSAYDPSTLSCPCIPGYKLVNGNCAKPYVPPTVPPTPLPPTCSINQKLVNGNCICLEGFYVIQGVCTYCAAPNYYDPKIGLCRPTCTANQVLDLNSLTCLCLSGFYNIQGVCGSCQAYSAYNIYTKTCDCIQGYVLSGSICIPKTQAPLPPTPLPVPPSRCGANQVYVNQQCICASGYYLIQGVCVQCPANTFYDPDLAICRKPCLANQVYNKYNNSCDCASAYFLVNGTCITCLGNTTYNPKIKACSCPEGYRNQGNFCVIGCGVNQVFNNGVCCCITGFYPVNGICGQCEWNQVYDQGLGICRLPCDVKRIYNLAEQRCTCLPQYFQLSDGTCGICPTHSQYDPSVKKCVCDDGYILNLGLCIAGCNPYEVYVNGTCKCKPGYYLIGYSCGYCPPLQVYDSTYRICRTPCKTNEFWNPTTRMCQCQPTFYLVGGVCSQCNATTQVYNQKLQCCDCIDGYQKVTGQGCNGVCTPICSVNEDWISGRCVCKPGYYLINNYCTQCPNGQFYDIYQRICRVQCGVNQVYDFNSGKCVCAPGFYIVLGTCSKCTAAETYNPYTQICAIVPCPGVNEFFSNITGQCICKPQYVRIRGVCTNCPPGYYYDSYSDQCLCKPGYREVNGFCQSVCPNDQVYINGACQCKDGSYPVNGRCNNGPLCQLYSHFDADSGCCVCNDGYAVINGKCSSHQYCGINGYLKYGQCYCNSGFYWVNNVCKPCGQNEGYNGYACECLNGFVANANGVCVKSNFIPTCYANERFDTSLGACVCIAGTQFLNGKCQTVVPCPANAQYNGVVCVCKTGYKLDNGQCVPANVEIPTCPSNSAFNGVSCSCVPGYYPINNVCSQCPANTKWDGSQCAATNTCASGYVYNTVSGKCEPSGPSCGDNAYWNGATCCCADGYNLINNICQACSAGTAFDGSQCSSKASNSCGSNQVSVNGQCVCANGFYLVNSQCISCPAYTTWNGSYCACNSSDSSQWCIGQPFTKVDSTGSCSCQNGYILTNGICVQSN